MSINKQYSKKDFLLWQNQRIKIMDVNGNEVNGTIIQVEDDCVNLIDENGKKHTFFYHLIEEAKKEEE